MTGGIRASLGVQNLTDKDPPLVVTGGRRGGIWDSGVHNIFGRVYQLELSKHF